MSNTIGFRKINKIERDIIINSFSKNHVKLQSNIENLKNRLYISLKNLKYKNNFPNIYLLSKTQINSLRTLKNNKIISAGIFFGFIKKGNFYLSLESAEFLYLNKIISGFKKVQVNNNGEKSILYGNDLLKKMIFKISDSFEQNDLLLIFNKSEEFLALAQSKIDSQNMQVVQPNEVIAKNLIDKGFYLRENQ
ncbi:MAG: PUA domain-containing protein [Promethearchaeota archaeon]